jgi:hypothetical protein
MYGHMYVHLETNIGVRKKGGMCVCTFGYKHKCTWGGRQVRIGVGVCTHINRDYKHAGGREIDSWGRSACTSIDI